MTVAPFARVLRPVKCIGRYCTQYYAALQIFSDLTAGVGGISELNGGDRASNVTLLCSITLFVCTKSGKLLSSLLYTPVAVVVCV